MGYGNERGDSAQLLQPICDSLRSCAGCAMRM
jgi:hypothetical protein